MLKLMYITRDEQVARIAEEAGVDRIFVDMETVGKGERQGGMDTVQSRHTVEDVKRLRGVLSRAELLVRVNQIYPGSQEEIRAVAEAGADIIMLPYFKTPEQVADFIRFVDGRAKTLLLFETPESAARIDEILALEGIDECFIGLNDLHLGYGQKFMFQPLADGTVEGMCRAFREAGRPYGFGGIARVGTGTLSAQRILGEHVRLGSGCVILSRSFCNADQIADPGEIRRIFSEEVPRIRQAEADWAGEGTDRLEENRQAVCAIVDGIVRGLS